MLSSLYQNGVVQGVIVLLTIPMWWPVVVLVRNEVRAAAEMTGVGVGWASRSGTGGTLGAGATPPLAPAHGTGRGLWEQAENSAWSKSRMVNADWDTGRRATGPTVQASRAHEPGSLTRSILAASERGARGSGRRPM